MGSNPITVRLFSLGILVVAFLSIGQTAKADEVTVSGFTNGCFGSGCVPGTTSGQAPVSLMGLTFASSTFNGTTSSGFLAIGNAPGTPNVANLGSFSLSGTPATYTGQAFTHRVTFTAPPGIAGPNNATFSANLMGSVTSNDVGGVMVDFNNTPTTFVFSFVNGAGQTVNGSFNFNVNDVSVIAGGTIGVSGNITGAQQTPTTVPEPAAMVLLGTGLVGVAAKFRKLRKH